jgi:hypothetical protein
MADYVKLQELKADLPDLDSGTLDDYDNVLAGMITAASRLIDKQVGGWDNYFYPSTSATIRYYDGSGEEEQNVDPMVSLSSVSVAESGGRGASDYTAWTLDTDYYVWPYNTTDTNDPIQMLIVDNDSGSKGVFYKGKKAVKVTGIFGYSETPPDDIKHACKITAMRWFMRSKQSYQDTSANAQLGQLLYTKSLDPDVKELLKPYQNFRLMI